MAETIRERIERQEYRFEVLSSYWTKGWLIPKDEVQARIDSTVTEAVRKERERCTEIVEDNYTSMQGSEGDALRLLCDNLAAVIRKEPDHD